MHFFKDCKLLLTFPNLSCRDKLPRLLILSHEISNGKVQFTMMAPSAEHSKKPLLE